ncbi:MAG: DUF58 domain-containing protein [Clostridiales bacterium]
MYISKYFILLILFGLIPISISILFDMFLVVFILYNLLLVLLFLIDLLITPGKNYFELERICDEKFSLGAKNYIAISIRNNSKYNLNFEATDEIPVHFKVYNRFLNIFVTANNTNMSKYNIIPQKRGEFTFGKIDIRYIGLLKLCIRSFKFDKTCNYKVYPNLRDLSTVDFITLKKISLIEGSKKNRAYLAGTEFESLREYAEGDDYKKLNWIASAKYNTLIVNNYEPEKNQNVYILLDSSRVMNSEINYIKKLDYAINASLLLADFVIKKGDKTGLLVFDSKIRKYVHSGKGKGHFQLFADNLYNVHENMVSADYKNAFLFLSKKETRQGLICIFTEIYNKEEAQNLTKVLKLFSKKHTCLIITIRDKRIYEIANSSLEENNNLYHKTAASKIINERENAIKIFNNSGITCIDVPPDKLSVEIVNKYLSVKQMQGF